MNDDEIKTALSKVQENWKTPTELARSTPRPVTMTWRGILFSCLAVLLLGVGAFLGPWLYVQSVRDNAFAQRMAVEGAVTSATVTEIGPAQGKEDHHTIRYRYQANGKTYDASTTVGSRAAKGLREENDVQVRYLTTQPERSWIVGHEPDRTPVWVPPLAGLAIMIGPAVIFFRIKKERSLLGEGRPAPGVITKVRWVGGNHGESNRRASYQFRAQDGQTYKGAFRGSTRRCGAAGDGVTILYDKDDPTRSARYPMRFVRLQEW